MATILPISHPCSETRLHQPVPLLSGRKDFLLIEERLPFFDGITLADGMEHIDYYIQIFDEIYHDSPLLCSFLSYILRAERTEHIDAFRGQRETTLMKEILASQLPDLQQQGEYRSIFSSLSLLSYGAGVVVPPPSFAIQTRFSRIYTNGIETLREKFPHYPVQARMIISSYLQSIPSPQV